jgi:hypothetical protein
MDQEQQLYGLMAIAEEQQKAVKAAIDGLAKERMALSQMASTVQKAAGSAVGDAVIQSLAGVQDEAANAIRRALNPAVERLASVVQTANEAERTLKNAGSWFAWKWVAMMAGCTGVLCLVSYAAVEYQVNRVAELQAEKAELQTTINELANKGGRLKFSACGGRLCVLVQDGSTWSSKNSDDQWVIPKGY